MYLCFMTFNQWKAEGKLSSRNTILKKIIEHALLEENINEKVLTVWTKDTMCSYTNYGKREIYGWPFQFFLYLTWWINGG